MQFSTPALETCSMHKCQPVGVSPAELSKVVKKTFKN